MKDTEIAAFFSVTKQAVGKVLEKARRNAMARILNKLQASPELEKWYEERGGAGKNKGLHIA